MDGVTDQLAKKFGVEGSEPDEALRAPELVTQPIAHQDSVTDQLSRKFLVDPDLKLGQSVNLGSQKHAERTARILNLKNRTNLPTQYIDDNLDELERLSSISRFSPEYYRKNSPKLAEWLSNNPDHASVATDDVSSLSTIERSLWIGKHIGRAVAAMLPQSISQTWALPRLIEDAVTELTPHSPVALATLMLSQISPLTQPGKQLAAEQAEKYAKMAEEWQGDISGVSREEQAMYRGFTSLGVMGLTLPLSIISRMRSAALIPMGVFTFGDTYNQMRDEGRGVIESVFQAAPDAAAEVITEQYGVGVLVKDFGLRKHFLGTLRDWMVMEGLGEQAATLWQDFNAWARENERRPFKAYLEERVPAAVDTFIGTLVAGGGMATAGAVVDRAMKRGRGNPDADIFRALGESAEESKLLERVPSKFREWVAHAKADGPIENVYIPVSRWDALFQEGGEYDPIKVQQAEATARQAAQELLGDTVQYDEAKGVSGGDLVVPLETYAEKLAGTDLDARLRPDIRLRLGGNSLREDAELSLARDDIQAAEDEQSQSEYELEGKLADIKKEVYDALRPSYGDAEARRQAGLISERYRDRAIRTARDVSELWAKEGPIATRSILEQPGALAQATDSPAFQRWFGDSKVVDAQGNPLVVYHGTDADFTMFRRNIYGDRFHFGTIEQAEQRANEVSGGHRANIIPAYLVIKNPLRLPDLNQWVNKSAWALARKSMPPKVSDMVWKVLDKESTNRFTFLDRIIEELERLGYDGIVYKNEHEGNLKDDSYIAFRSEQVKSAIGNIGTYDPSDPNILRQEAEETYPWYRSALKDAVAASQTASAASGQWLATLRNTPGVKPAEIAATGLEEFLSMQRGKVSRETILDYLNSHGPELEETMLGGPQPSSLLRRVMEADDRYPGGWTQYDWWSYSAELEVQAQEYQKQAADAKGRQASRYQNEARKRFALAREANRIAEGLDETGSAAQATKFSQWQLPGGTDYRELLIRLPQKIPSELPPEYEAKKISNKSWGIFGPGPLSENRYASGPSKEEAIATFFRMHGASVGSPSFIGPHFAETNILTHVRFNTREVNGKKVLFLEEIQSDWAQKGREEGFDDGIPNIEGLRTKQVEDGTWEAWFGEFQEPWTGATEREAYANAARELIDQGVDVVSEVRGGVPSAPFVTKTEAWVGLALKRMIRYAVDNGYDQIAWTTGEQQAARYDLSKQVDTIQVLTETGKGDTYTVEAYRGGFRVVHKSGLTAKELPNAIGKELAERAINELPSKAEHYVEFSGLDLKVGGEGMKAFYDRIVPNTANKILKQLGGGRVGEVDIELEPTVTRQQLKIPGAGKQESLQPSFDITPEMKKNVMQGMTLFQSRKIIRAQYEPSLAASIRHLEELAEQGRASMEDLAKLRRRKEVAGAYGVDTNSLRPLITLFKQANPSSLLHELGHSWLEELRRDAAYAQQQLDAGVTENVANFQQLIADWGTVKAWANIGDLADHETIPRASHEQFARTVEAYVQEGKAPSVELRNVFARFKDWLVRLYKNLEGLAREAGFDIEINDEIRGVMDRLLATDEQIAEVRRLDGMERPVVPFEAMTTAESKALRNMMEDAQREAEDDVRTKAMAELIRERQDWWKREKAQVAEEVAGDFNEQPVYRALSWLRTGKLPDGTELEGIEHQRLSRDILVSVYGAPLTGIAIRDMPPFTYQREGGLHPDVAAEMFGFTNGEEMLRAMIGAKNRTQEIAKEVDRVMMERYGDMLNDGSLAERAAEAVHGDKQAEVLLAELRILNRMGAKGRLVPRQVFQQIAEQNIAGKTVGELRPSYYEIMARRAGYEAEKAMINDEVDAAFEAKVKQIQNLFLFREAVKQKQAIDKSIKGWTGRHAVLNRSDERLRKFRDIDLVNAARAILGNFGIGRGEGTAAEHLAKLSEYDPQTYQDMLQVIAPIAGERKPYKQLTLSEFAMVRDAVDGLLNSSRAAKQMLIDGRKVSKDIASGELVGRLQQYRKPKEKSKYTGAMTRKEKNVGTLLGIKAWGRRVESWVDAIDGGDFEGPFRKYIWLPISEATTHYREVRKNVLQRYLEIVKGIEGSFKNEKVTSEVLGHEFGRESGNARQEIIGALLHSGNQSNLQKLLLGRGWGSLREDGTLDTSRWDAFINEMAQKGKITKADYDFVQNVWDLLEELKPDAQRAHRDIYGYFFSEITASPVNTPFGQYRGGYFPAIVDSSIVDDAAVREDIAAMQEQQNSFMFPTTGRGFTMSRVRNYNKALKLDVGIIPQHIDKVLKFTYIEPRMKEVGRLMLDTKFRDAMKSVDPMVIGTMIMPWLQRAATQSVDSRAMDPTARTIDKVWRGLRTRTGAQIMVGNVVNTLQQYTGFSLAATKVSPAYLNDALWTYVHSPTQTGKEIAEKSEFMRNRVTTAVFEVQQEIDDILLNPSMYEKARAFASKHGYFLQTHAQSQVDTVAWLGAYNEAIANGVDEKGAIRRADSAVRLTQGTFAAEDISRFETGSPLMRVFTMFYSYFNMQANLLTTEFSKIIQDTGFSAPGRLFYMYMIGFMIPAVVAESIAQLLSGEAWEDADDDDDWLMKKMLEIFFMGQIRTGLALAGPAGQAVTVGINQYNDKWYDDRISTSPVVGAIEATMRAPRSIYRAVTDTGSDRRAVRDTLTAISLITGLPVAFLGRPLGYLADINEGRAEPANPADFVRGLISGRAPQ